MTFVEISYYRRIESNKDYDRLFCAKEVHEPLTSLQNEKKVFEIDASIEDIDNMLNLSTNNFNYGLRNLNNVFRTINSNVIKVNQFKLSKKMHFYLCDENIFAKKAKKITLKEFYKLILNDELYQNINEFSTEDLTLYIKAKMLNNVNSEELMTAKSILDMISSSPINVALTAITFLS